MPSGYLSHPALSAEHVAFVCEDALWIAPRGDGTARRLTAGTERLSTPCFAPDGETLAYTSDADGNPQVWLLALEGGAPRRVTAEVDGCALVGFHPDGRLVLRSRRQAPLGSDHRLWTVRPDGTGLALLPVGRAMHVSFAQDGERVALGLNRVDIAYWKRYRGGTHGDVWAGSLATGDYRRLLSEEHNAVLPQVAGERVWFVSDHNGHGNLWSVPLAGGEPRQHTRFRDYYPRHLARHGTELVFAKGAELFHHDTVRDETTRLDVRVRPSGAHLVPRFVDAVDELQEQDLAPDGRQIACTVRGKALVARAWGGAVRPMGTRSGVRYRLPVWLAPRAKDGEGDATDLLLVSDEGDEEGLEVWAVAEGERRVRVEPAGLARVVDVVPAPRGRRVAVSDIRGRLAVLDLDQPSAPPRVVFEGDAGEVSGVAWSPDGRWLAFVEPLSFVLEGGILRLVELTTGRGLALNEPDLPTHSPAFDPKGRFLWALSDRTFDPVMDTVQLGAATVCSTRVYAWVLSADGLPPTDPRFAETLEDDDKEKDDERDAERDGERNGGSRNGGPRRARGAGEPEPVRIDLDGLAARVVALTEVEAGTLGDLAAWSGGVCWLDWPLTGLETHDKDEDRERDLPDLVAYDLAGEKVVTMQENARSYRLRGGKVLIRSHAGLRLAKAGEEPPEEPAKDGKNRHTGQIDLERLRVEVTPADEWRQMFVEAWRMQRDFFWDARMAGVDWPAVREHYLPVLAKIATRAELSDLIWEMQGELGTSHAYEFGGDYPETRRHPIGGLGADLAWDGRAWRVERVLCGDPGIEGACSPLAAPAVGVRAGDRIRAIDGLPLDERTPPEQALVHRAGERVELLVEPAGAPSAPPRRVVVETLKSERGLRYRDWVLANRARVRAASGGRLGYLHLPDMGGRGLAELHRAFRTESKHEGLVVDVRANGGGFVSELAIEMLRRVVIGYEIPRHRRPWTYPLDAVRGPIVGLCDQFAGSDGDVFCHAFKRYQLGKLVGKRTWGGVVGIDLNGHLADGTVVTQPEYALSFLDVGWGVENRGVEPDVVVDLDPASSAAGRDPQLDRAIAIALAELEASPIPPPRRDAVPSRRFDLAR